MSQTRLVHCDSHGPLGSSTSRASRDFVWREQQPSRELQEVSDAGGVYSLVEGDASGTGPGYIDAASCDPVSSVLNRVYTNTKSTVDWAGTKKADQTSKRHECRINRCRVSSVGYNPGKSQIHDTSFSWGRILWKVLGRSKI
ncbi:hypothetical protein RRG08_031047 [Elysia crispata]|uniref:Uncharacterized protein n=1 Tax=Elysia crispata TaxID=231223 RepID=A0AAE1DG50_9GAST|nr:hypothetical protein RRG08_031047 [Elysia crispata]